MRVVVLGAAGMLGSKLVKALLNDAAFDNEGKKKSLVAVTAFDRVEPHLDEGLAADSRLSIVTGDINDGTVIERLISPETSVIYHLAAVVSAEAEKDFSLGMQVNVHATQRLLEHCRQLPQAVKFIFASSVAVFGGELPAIVPDTYASMPQSSYGTQKAMMELLISDYSRKGFIDARVLRLPTIVVRAGRPNAATSTFASSIIREPLQGQQAICPVLPETRLWIQSPRQAIKSLIKAGTMSAESLGSQRILSLPGLSISVQEMVDSLAALGGDDVAQRISWQFDPFTQSIVGSWPAAFEATRAKALGFEADASMAAIIQVFIEDDLIQGG